MVCCCKRVYNHSWRKTVFF